MEMFSSIGKQNQNVQSNMYQSHDEVVNMGRQNYLILNHNFFAEDITRLVCQIRSHCTPKTGPFEIHNDKFVIECISNSSK
jgi:hypothetical protein